MATASGELPEEGERHEQAVARAVVAHVCRSLGFTGVRWEALDALAAVMLRFMREVGAGAHASAEASGRATINASDALDALSCLRVPPSAIARFLAGDAASMQPPPVSLASPHRLKRPRLNPSFARSSSTPPAHVPTFLPAFPDQQAFASPNSQSRPLQHQQQQQQQPSLKKQTADSSSGTSLKHTHSKLLSERRSAERSLLQLTEQLEQQHKEQQEQQQRQQSLAQGHAQSTAGVSLHGIELATYNRSDSTLAHKNAFSDVVGLIAQRASEGIQSSESKDGNVSINGDERDVANEETTKQDEHDENGQAGNSSKASDGFEEGRRQGETHTDGAIHSHRNASPGIEATGANHAPNTLGCNAAHREEATTPGESSGAAVAVQREAIEPDSDDEQEKGGTSGDGNKAGGTNDGHEASDPNAAEQHGQNQDSINEASAAKSTGKRKRENATEKEADVSQYDTPLGVSFGIVAAGRKARAIAKAARGGAPKAEQSPVPTFDNSMESWQMQERVERLLQQEQQSENR